VDCIRASVADAEGGVGPICGSAADLVIEHEVPVKSLHPQGRLNGSGPSYFSPRWTSAIAASLPVRARLIDERLVSIGNVFARGSKLRNGRYGAPATRIARMRSLPVSLM